jgi:hypothetical protein
MSAEPPSQFQLPRTQAECERLEQQLIDLSGKVGTLIATSQNVVEELKGVKSDIRDIKIQIAADKEKAAGPLAWARWQRNTVFAIAATAALGVVTVAVGKAFDVLWALAGRYWGGR